MLEVVCPGARLYVAGYGCNHRAMRLFRVDGKEHAVRLQPIHPGQQRHVNGTPQGWGRLVVGWAPHPDNTGLLRESEYQALANTIYQTNTG